MRIGQKFSYVRGFEIHVDRRQSSAESGISKGDCCKYWNNTPFRLVSLIYLYDEIYRYNEFDAKFSGCGVGGS